LDGLTAISTALVDRAVALGCDPQRCIVIHGAADLDTFAQPASREEARQGLGLPLDAPVLCFSGLDVLIDLPMAVRTFEYVREEFPSAMLLLVGPTEELARTLVHTPATMNFIRALGPIPYKQLPQVLPAADVFLMPFQYKIANVGRWPNKVGDYMAVGRPTVSNPVGEVKWLFERYKLGRLSDENPTSMADASLSLLQHPEEADALGRNARRVAEEEFNVSHQVARLNEWYLKCLSSMDI
jgi:glycosyltransferase involved in cell wall biosynthesis